MESGGWRLSTLGGRGYCSYDCEGEVAEAEAEVFGSGGLIRYGGGTEIVGADAHMGGVFGGHGVCGGVACGGARN